MGELKTNKNIIFSIVLIIILGSLIIGSINVKAQPPTIVKGYVYIDGKITQPEKVNLTFTSQSINAAIHDQSYLIVFTGEEVGSIGEFYIVYSERMYSPPEKVTILENEYIYNIDLHINTSYGGQPYVEPTNIQPETDAGGPYFECVGVSIQFNGTKSTDPDGSIIKYEWDFGDTTTATEATPTHLYKKVGNYTVTLKVTDNNGSSTQNSTYALITKTLNYPPNKPQINGSTTGTINRDYNFYFQATDPDNDKIQYNINWSDDTEITTTEYLQNGTIVTVTHNWTEPGIYTIRAYAIDDNDAISEITELVILIDTIYCKDLGYLTDYTSDGIYDLFYSNITGLETPVVFENGLYIIDVDNNGEYDYKFNIATNDLNAYTKAEIKEQGINLLEITKPYLPYIILFLFIVLLILVKLIIFNNTKQKPKIEKIYYYEKKDGITEKEILTKNTVIGPKYEKLRSIEEEVDELLSKRK